MALFDNIYKNRIEAILLALTIVNMPKTTIEIYDLNRINSQTNKKKKV